MKNNYITIQGWMVTELKLSGNQLLAYALIFGFSQDGKNEFTGSINYICGWLNCSRPTVTKALNELAEKKYIEKAVRYINGVQFNTYKVSLGVVKNLYGGSKESLHGGSKETLHNNTNIYKDNNKDREEAEKNFSSDSVKINDVENDVINGAEKRKRKVAPKEKETLYTEFVKIHYEFYKEQTGLPYKFTKGDGDAIKSIITYLKQVAEEKQKEPAEIWKFILKNYELWDEFFKKQIKPVQINSNISNIILNIKKHGSSKNKWDKYADIHRELSEEWAAEERAANMG
jgi:hypothetical protein